MGNFLKTKFNRIKNLFKNNSNKAFGKIGLFLIFGIMILNLNLGFRVDHNIITYDLHISSVSAGNYEDMGFWEAFVESFLDSYKGSTTEAIVDTVADGAGNTFLWAFNMLLGGVLYVLQKLLTFAGVLMELALKESFFKIIYFL